MPPDASTDPPAAPRYTPSPNQVAALDALYELLCKWGAVIAKHLSTHRHAPPILSPGSSNGS